MDDVLREVEEIEKLRGYVQEMQAKLGDFVVHADFEKTKNDLRNLTDQVNYNKEDVEELKREVEKIKDFIDKLHFPSMDDFKMMRSRQDSLENQVASLRKAVGELDKRMRNLKPGGGADEGVLNKCVEELQRLRAEFEAHRDHTNRNMDHVLNELPQKADKKELYDLENRIMEKLKDMIH